MFWMLAAAGTASVMKGNVARMQDKAGNVLGEARASAANTIRAGKNAERAAVGSLSRFMQSENNKRRMTAAGQVYNSAQEELYRTIDFGIDSSIERQLANAEVAGALAANSAFAGAAGSSSDVLAMTTSLKAARQKRLQDKRQKQITYEQVKQLTGIMPQAIASLDMTNFDDGSDRSEDWNQYINKSTSSWVGDFAKGALTAYISAGVGAGLDKLAGNAAAAQTYGTTLGSQQTAMLAAQDSAFGIGVNASRAFQSLQL